MRYPSVFRNIPRTVWALGFVSLFMDVSSEMIHSLLPVFLVVGLNASVLSLGIIEGVAEATALITKVFSGIISDWMGRRKILAVAGYALGTLTKPLFAMATGIQTVFTARFLDRIRQSGDATPTVERDYMRSVKFMLDDVKAAIRETSKEAQNAASLQG